MNYSYHCKTCGYTIMSDKKGIVKRAKEKHTGGCPVVPLRNGHISRPDLYERRVENHGR